MLYQRMCAECAGKIGGGNYVVIEQPGTETSGICPHCFRMTTVHMCELSPRRQQFARRSGGGERRRAGRSG